MQDPLLYCRKTISRANATQTPQWGAGGTHMRGEKGQGWSHSKHGLAGSPEPGVPRQDGLSGPSCGRSPFSPGDHGLGRGRGLEVGGAPGRLCYQGVSLRKGCRPLPSKAQETLPGWGREQHQLLVDPGPAAGWGGSAVLRQVATSSSRGAVPVPGRDTHTCTHTFPPSLHSVPSKHLQSHTNTDRTKRTATKMDRNGPSYPQTVHRTATWSF